MEPNAAQDWLQIAAGILAALDCSSLRLASPMKRKTAGLSPQYLVPWGRLRTLSYLTTPLDGLLRGQLP
jgi:hypothetical protein